MGAVEVCAVDVNDFALAVSESTVSMTDGAEVLMKPRHPELLVAAVGLENEGTPTAVAELISVPTPGAGALPANVTEAILDNATVAIIFFVLMEFVSCCARFRN